MVQIGIGGELLGNCGSSHRADQAAFAQRYSDAGGVGGDRRGGGWEDIEEFGHSKHEWLKQYLSLENGIPSHDTISRVFRALKPNEFNSALTQWLETLHEQLGFQQIAIDGKTLRRSHDRSSMQATLHLVSAWSVANQLVLGQEATAAKSNEITAIPNLLQILELKGALVTLDAMGCQKEIARQIVGGGGDYVLAVKDNQPTLQAAISDYFLHLHETDFAGCEVRRWTTIDEGHGRHQRRTYYVTPLPESMQFFAADWKKLTSIGQAINISFRDGREVADIRYFILSMPPQVKPSQPPSAVTGALRTASTGRSI